MTDEPIHTPAPIQVMKEYGFGLYAQTAREVLPKDWWRRYGFSAELLARGLTYYVAYDDFTQAEIAERYDRPDSPNTVCKPYRVLRADLGLPQDHPAIESAGPVR